MRFGKPLERNVAEAGIGQINHAMDIFIAMKNTSKIDWWLY